jgi:hypothetical protein
MMFVKNSILRPNVEVQGKRVDHSSQRPFLVAKEEQKTNQKTSRLMQY